MLPPAESCHLGATPKPVQSADTASSLVGEPQTSAAALGDHAPSWWDDMGDDILKMLIARANFYDKAIRYRVCPLSFVCGGHCRRWEWGRRTHDVYYSCRGNHRF